MDRRTDERADGQPEHLMLSLTLAQKVSNDVVCVSRSLHVTVEPLVV